MNHEVEREEGELAKLRRDLAQAREDYERACRELNHARITIGEREVLHQTEQAKLRRQIERVMALPRYIISTDENGDPMPLEVSEGEYPMVVRLASADDIDEALKEVGGE